MDEHLEFDREIAALVAKESRSLSAIEQLRLALGRIQALEMALDYMAGIARRAVTEGSDEHIEVVRLCEVFLPRGYQL